MICLSLEKEEETVTRSAALNIKRTADYDEAMDPRGRELIRELS